MRQWPDYRRVAETTVGGFWVSTVWIGLDHSFGGGPPLIFETMVFEAEASWYPGREESYPGHWYHRDYEQIRYFTEEDAQTGHDRLVEEISLLEAARPDPRGEA